MPSLEELFAPIRLAEPRPAPPPSEAEFHAWLAARNPELAEWNAFLAQTMVRAGYRNGLFAATAPTLGEVLAVPHDGCRAARIRSVFGGVSAVLEDAEELWLASWEPSAEGTSVVFASHQDERDLWPVTPSLRDFLLLQYQEDSYFQRDLQVPEAISALPVRTGGAPLRAAYDLPQLTARAHWIVALLFPEGDWYGLGNGLVAAPAFERFVEEEAALAETPHLLAYWLLHHRVFDNRIAFERIRGAGEASAYPAARELAAGAVPAWWDTRAIEQLRSEALRDRPDVLEPEALRATNATRESRAGLAERVTTRLAPLPMTAAKMLVLAILEGAKLDAIELEVIRDVDDAKVDPAAADREIEARLLAKRGDAPGLGVLFEQVVRDLDASWEETANDLAALSATGGASADLNAVALLLLAASPSWPDVVARAASFGATDRLGRLAQAAVAVATPGDAGLAFLRDEAVKFIDRLHEASTDTAAFAMVGLVRRHDEPTLAALTTAIRTHAPRGGPGRALLELFGDDPAFAAPLEAFVLVGFGRAAEGEPIAYAATLGKVAPDAARDFAAANLETERRAAALAASLSTDPNDETVLEQARSLLATLDPKKEREAATALALLRVAHEANALGFAESAARWRSIKRSKHVGAALTRWFERHAAEIR